MCDHLGCLSNEKDGFGDDKLNKKHLGKVLLCSCFCLLPDFFLQSGCLVVHSGAECFHRLTLGGFA